MDRGLAFIITFGIFAVSMALAMIAAERLTAAARSIALRYGIVSHVTERSSHTHDTARLGGLGLCGGFAMASALFLATLWVIPHTIAMVGFNPALLGWLIFGWAGMFLTGLLDDLTDLKPLVKLALMAIAAVGSVWGGGMAPQLIDSPFIPSRLQYAVEIAAAVVWVLFFTNGFNFMDGMDGFAANFARAASAFMFLTVLIGGFIYKTPQYIRGEAYLLPIMAMACWGFLHWNKPPAKVFMGDCGSLSLGYMLAVYPLLGMKHALGQQVSALTSATILMPFLFDVILTLIRRARRGENLLKAHHSHLYQRLMQTGLTHAQVLSLNLRLFMLCGVAALAGAHVRFAYGQWIGLLVAFAAMNWYWRYTLKREKDAAARA
ncbi:hypothetical protein LLG95_12275 [bacterium]|nr:hypothetical protein [bacterium]